MEKKEKEPEKGLIEESIKNFVEEETSGVDSEDLTKVEEKGKIKTETGSLYGKKETTATYEEYLKWLKEVELLEKVDKKPKE